MISTVGTLVLALVQGIAGLPADPPDPSSPTAIAVILPTPATSSMLEALHRLRGEADSVGIKIRLVDVPAGVGTDPQAQLAYAAHIMAPAAVVALVDKVVAEVPAPVVNPREEQARVPVAAIDAWLFDNTTGKTSVGHLTVDKDAGDQVELVLAVRVVDFIRAQMFDSLVRRRLDEAKAKQRPIAPHTMTGRRCLTVGMASTGSASGFSPVLLPLVQIGFGVRPWLWLTLGGAGFGTQFRRATAAGSVSIDQTSASVGVVMLSRVGWRVAPFVSAGAWLSFVSVHGRGESGYLGHDVSRWSPGGFATVGAAVMLTSHLLLQLSGGAIVLARPPRVFIAGAEVATTGRPAWLASTSIGVTF